MVRLQRNKYLIPSGKVIYGLITNAYNFYHPSYFLQPVVKIKESQRPLEDHPHTPLALCHTDLDTAHSCRINPTEHKPGAGRPQWHPGRHQHSLCCHRHWGCPWGGSDSASSCFPLGPRTVLAAFDVPQNQLGSDLKSGSRLPKVTFSPLVSPTAGTQETEATFPAPCQTLAMRIFTPVDVPYLTSFHSLHAHWSQMFIYLRMK